MTALLEAWSGGDDAAGEELLRVVYAELRQIAAGYLAVERAGHTLQPTALVHEAYLRLVGQRRIRWQNRSHFYGIAARMIRRILVDHARKVLAAKRGGGRAVRVPLDEADEPLAERPERLVALDEALERLARLDPEQAAVVTYRFFGGLTHEEIAEVMDSSPATVQRRWRVARAWLFRQLGPGDSGAG